MFKRYISEMQVSESLQREVGRREWRELGKKDHMAHLET